MKIEVTPRTRGKIIAFGRKFSPAHVAFACHAALPLALTPELLYRLRLNFQKDISGNPLKIPWIAVSDLLLSSLCEEVGYELYEMEPAVRQALLTQLTEDPRFTLQRQREVASFLWEYVRHDLNSSDSYQRDFAESQSWAATAYQDSRKSVEYLAAAFNRAYQENPADLMRLATLTEMLYQPIPEFDKLRIFARAMGHYARNQIDESKQEIIKLPIQGGLISLGNNIVIPVPTELLDKSQFEQVKLVQSLFSIYTVQGQSKATRTVLNNSQYLITDDFLYTINQVISLMFNEGNEDIANWFRNISAQVSENIVETYPYLELLIQLLQTIVDSNSDTQVIYPLLQRNVDKLNDQFAATMVSWANANLPNTEKETAQAIAAAIGNLSNLLIQQFPFLSYRATNLVDIAITGYNIGLTVFEQETNSEQWAMTQNNLANAYNQRIKGSRAENLERAIVSYQAALIIYTHENFPENWAMTQNNIASVYSSRTLGNKAENLENAIDHYQAALTIYTHENFPENWAGTQNNLANAYSDRIYGSRAENLERAIVSYQDALTVYTIEDFPRNYAETLFNLGVVYQSLARFGDAYTALAQSINTVELVYNDLLDTFSRSDFNEEWNKLYTKIVEICLELGNYTSAFEYVNRRKAFPNCYGSYFKSRIQSRVQNIIFDQIKNVLDKETVILEWYILEHEFITFIITNQTQSPIVWRSSQEDLENLIDFSTKYLDTYRTDRTKWLEQLTQNVSHLSKILHLDEILDTIASYSRLCLVPHRYLNNFPIHALPIGVEHDSNINSQYLLNFFPEGIQYIPNCEFLVNIPDDNHQDFSNLFAIADSLENIKGSNIEVKAIQQYFLDSTVLMGYQATKEAVMNSSQLSSAHCLHISGHSFFNFESPFDSAIVLANTEGTSDKSQANVRNTNLPFNITQALTIAEIYQMNLSQCHLVNLSASETALVDISRSSDEISFQTAFLVAGADSVIGSLWTPNCFSTTILMIKFYQNLFQGITISSALSQAQIWIRTVTIIELENWIENSTFPDKFILHKSVRDLGMTMNNNECPFANPFYWAAFKVTGMMEISRQLRQSTQS